MILVGYLWFLRFLDRGLDMFHFQSRIFGIDQCDHNFPRHHTRSRFRGTCRTSVLLNHCDNGCKPHLGSLLVPNVYARVSKGFNPGTYTGADDMCARQMLIEHTTVKTLTGIYIRYINMYTYIYIYIYIALICMCINKK